MPFDPSDARSKLAGGNAVKEPPKAFAGAEYLKFYETPPTVVTDGGRTWYARGQNFVVGYSELDGEADFARTGQPDEYVVLLADDAPHRRASRRPARGLGVRARRCSSCRPATAR